MVEPMVWFQGRASDADLNRHIGNTGKMRLSSGPKEFGDYQSLRCTLNNQQHCPGNVGCCNKGVGIEMNLEPKSWDSVLSKSPRHVEWLVLCHLCHLAPCMKHPSLGHNLVALSRQLVALCDATFFVCCRAPPQSHKTNESTSFCGIYCLEVSSAVC